MLLVYPVKSGERLGLPVKVENVLFFSFCRGFSIQGVRTRLLTVTFREFSLQRVLAGKSRGCRAAFRVSLHDPLLFLTCDFRLLDKGSPNRANSQSAFSAFGGIS